MLKLKVPALALLLIGLAGCLTGQRPNLSEAELIQVEGLAGTYQATIKSDATGQSGKTKARIEAQDDHSYRIFLTEDDGNESPDPMLARILSLEADTQLIVITKPSGSDDIAQFALLTAGDKGAWSLSFLDIAEDRRNKALAPIVEKHGASIAFRKGFGKATNDRLDGVLTGRQLRDLYGDPEFLAATRILATVKLIPQS
jgi:hypothetical protein